MVLLRKPGQNQNVGGGAGLHHVDNVLLIFFQPTYKKYVGVKAILRTNWLRIECPGTVPRMQLDTLPIANVRPPLQNITNS